MNFLRIATTIFIISVIAALHAITPMQQKNRVKIMTYNIHNAIGMDKRLDVRRIADVIERSGADFVALQEIDSATVRSDGRYILGEIASETLMRPVFGGAIDFQGGRYGIGVLSRERPLSVRQIALPGSEEKRTLLLVEFEKFVFASTHFSLTEADRLKSAEILVNEAGLIDKPLIVGGDFNDDPSSVMYERMLTAFTPLSDVKSFTFPSDRPESTIDYLFIKDDRNEVAKIASAVVFESKASDHRPVVSTVQFKARPENIFYKKPYLQNVSSDAITVMFQTNVMAHCRVEYGTDTLNLRQAVELAAGQAVCHDIEHKVRLNGLTPGKKYYYRIVGNEIVNYLSYSKILGDTCVTPFYTFELPERDARDFTFLVVNDLHDNWKTIEMMGELAASIPHDMVIFNGDCMPEPVDRNFAMHFIHNLNKAFDAANKPVMFIRGNHEIRNSYSAGLSSLFDNPGGKTYGAFSWGDTRIVVLDCGEDKPDTHPVYYGLNDFSKLRTEQLDWLKSETASNEFRQSGRKILIHHIPVWGNTDKYQPCTEMWAPYLKKVKFDLDIAGHTHEYNYMPADKGNGNPFPVVIGGGPLFVDATMMVVKRKGERMSVTVLSADGTEFNHIEL